MSDEFKPGGVVQLKSGGPKMTVESVGTTTTSDAPHAFCVWFEGTKQHRDAFPLFALKVPAGISLA